MSYEKQNHTDGTILYADSLNAMDNQIAELTNQIETLTTTLANIKIPRYNLLDNSDFVNPINQRGITSHTTSAEYCIDRWRHRNTGEVTLAADGLQITSVGSFGGLFQPIENGINRLAGKTVTMAAYILENTSGCQMQMCNATGSYVAGTSYGVINTKSTGIIVSSCTLPDTFEDGNFINFYIGEGNNYIADGILKIAWVALYEGEYTVDTLPPYQSKGYAAELLECQRYYLKVPVNNTLLIGTSGDANGAAVRLFLSTPIQMRKAPTLPSSITLSFSRSTGTLSNVTYTPSSAVACPTGIAFYGTTSSVISSSPTYIDVVCQVRDSDLELSAEI